MKYKVKNYQHTRSLCDYIKSILEGKNPPDVWVPKNTMIKGTNGKQHVYIRVKEGKGQIFVNDESDPFGYYADFLKSRVNRYIPNANVELKKGTGSDLELKDFPKDPFTIIQLNLN